MSNPVGSKTPSALRQVLALIGWLLFCFIASASAAFIPIGTWYQSLNKPSWNPPAWIFGPVWTVLYILMAVAAWLVWREGGWNRQKLALGLFVGQWILNAIWTPLFFGLHLIGLAFIDIAMLWLMIAATTFAFWRVSKPAGLLLLPYLAWVSFASVLNFVLWRLNG
ncbi:MAG: tryptophan-rich sensory protein [Planctomycetes bacterium]|nr:tryptophan-rich sensory protein [Planctomycetota bacterium]